MAPTSSITNKLTPQIASVLLQSPSQNIIVHGMTAATRSAKHEGEKDPARIMSGLRAALDDPSVSPGAKEKAVRKLDGCADVDMPEEIERAARTALSQGPAAVAAVTSRDVQSPGEDNADEMDPITAYSTYVA